MSTPKIERVFFDIETAPNIGLFWRAGYKLSIPPENIIQERAIICICWMVEGKKKVHSLEWDNGCDKKMIKTFRKVIEGADELVGHNVDRFDLKWFKGRLLIHGLEPLPKSKTVDTLKIARSQFSLNSNKLDYIAKLLFGEGKSPTGFGLWRDILLDNCPKAMKVMVDYCKRDVQLLKRVYDKLAPYDAPKTHVGVLNGREKWSCARCGSEDVKKHMTKVSAVGTKRNQMKCHSCFGTYTVSEKAHRDYREFRDDQKERKRLKRIKDKGKK